MSYKEDIITSDGVSDVTRTVTWRIEPDNQHHPESIFLASTSGAVVEFDRAEFVSYAAEALGLVDPLELLLDAPAAREVPAVCASCRFALLR